MSVLWKLGGAVCNQPDVLDALAHHYQQERPEWVLMHGAGPQLDAALRQVDGEPRKVAGLRVTSTASAAVVVEVMDQVGERLVTLLQQRGVPAVHVPAASGWLQGTPKSDALGRVGTPTAVDAKRIRAIVETGGVPVVSPAAWDAEGPLNVNADEAAAAAAGGLGCSALHLVTDVPHVRAGQQAVLDIDIDGALALIAAGHAQGGMVPKIEAACLALRQGAGMACIGDVATILAGGGTRIVSTLKAVA